MEFKDDDGDVDLSCFLGGGGKEVAKVVVDGGNQASGSSGPLGLAPASGGSGKQSGGSGGGKGGGSDGSQASGSSGPLGLAPAPGGQEEEESKCDRCGSQEGVIDGCANDYFMNLCKRCFDKEAAESDSEEEDPYKHLPENLAENCRTMEATREGEGDQGDDD